MKKIVFVTSFMVVFGMVMAVNASAALTLSLNAPNAALSGLTGPYATVKIELQPDSTHAIITFTRENSYFLGDGQIANLNVNATSYEIQNGLAGITFTGGVTGNSDLNKNTHFTGISLNQNVSDFGIFNLSIDSFDGAKLALNSLTFTLFNTSGTWASESSVLTPNASGYSAAAHIFSTNQDGATTGFAAVPIPGTVYLLGSGLAGLVGIGRWRRRK